MKLYSLIFTALCFIFIQSCNTPEVKPNLPVAENFVAQKPGFIHTVFFWMKEDISVADHEKFKKELAKLEKCSSIQSVYWGPPAISERDVVDSSFDYAWVVHFKNSADQDAYQVDPIHLAFVESCKNLWEKVQVFDNFVSN